MIAFSAQDNWQKLTSLLSGQFCASINLIKPTETIRPKAAFRPFLSRADSVAQSFFANGSSTDQFTASQQKEYGFMAALPQEAICTENLTPWTKLLPCRGRKGIGSLLVATNLFNSQFISLSLDFRFTCSVWQNQSMFFSRFFNHFTITTGYHQLRRHLGH